MIAGPKLRAGFRLSPVNENCEHKLLAILVEGNI